MRMIPVFVAGALGALACLGATSVAADTTLVYNADGETLKMRIRAGEVRIDDSGKRWQLYLQAENSIFSVNPNNNTYVRMDQGTARTIRKKLQALQQQIEERLAKLPPKQRQAARKMLAGKLPGFGDDKGQVTVQPTGNTARVAGRLCRLVEIRRDGRTIKQLCVAEPESLGISPAAFESLKSMFGLMSNMLAGTRLGYVGAVYLKLGGIPIRSSNGSGKAKRTLSRVSHGQLSDLVFQIPPSYKQVEPQPGQ